MRKFMVFLTAWFFLAATAAAHADPVTTLLFGAAFAASFAGQAVSFLLVTALSIGSSLLQKALAPKQKDPGVKTQMQVGGDNPLSFIMGHYATPGQLEYVNTRGKSHSTENAYETLVISLGDMPFGSLTGIWVDDLKVTVPDMSGTEPSSYGWPIPEFRHDNTDRMWVKFYDGTQTAADSFLLSGFGGDSARPYLSDMIGRGVPYVMVTMRFKPEVYQGTPRFLFETDGIPLYDIRKDTSAGGSGSHRWDDQSTWEPSDNPIVHVYNICRGIYYGDEWMWGGQTTEAFQLPATNWMAAMNAADTSVGLADGGTEKAYRAGREITVDEQPLDVIEDYMRGCSGRFAEIGGVYKVLAGAPGAAVYSFTDDQIIISKEQSFDPFPGLEQTFNGAQASYPEPAEKWGMKDAPAYYRSDLEPLDDNRRLVTGLQFPTVPYAVQVQRLLKAAVEDARRFKQHQFYLPPDAWLLEPNDVVSWTSARNGYDEKKFIVTSIAGGSNFLQLVNLKEIDPSDYDWTAADDEQSYSLTPVGPIDVVAQPMTGWNAAPVTITDNAGNNRRPGIEVSFAGDQDDVRDVRVQVRKSGETALEFDGSSPYGDVGDDDSTRSVKISFASILPDTAYEVRGKFIPYSTRTTLWSSQDDDGTEGAWLGVTTDDIRFGRLDLYDGVIDIPALSPEVQYLAQKWSSDVRALSEQIAQVALGDADGQFGAYQDVQASYQKVISQTGNLSAAVEQAIAAATGPDSAMATAITALNASDTAGNVADATFQIKTGYTPSTGWDSTIGFQVRTGHTGTFTDAGFFMEAKDDGTSRILMDADSIVMVNGAYAAQPFVFTGGVLTLQAANIGTVTAGIIKSPDDLFVITVAEGKLEWFEET